jgi:predicted RNase H-like nuclease (RuvC/YqgF family)
MTNIFLDSFTTDPLTSLNDTGDLTRMAYSNKSSDIPLRNSSMTDRFESDTFINNKESFEGNNSRINDLNEEIRELKMKCRVIYEKDEIIGSLKTECMELTRSLEDYEKSKGENIYLRKEQIRLKDEISTMQSKMITLESDLLSKGNKDIDEGSDRDDKISVDIGKIKKILVTRLKDTHEKHIDDLINQYHLSEKKEIDKSLMEELLYKAIHL